MHTVKHKSITFIQRSAFTFDSSGAGRQTRLNLRSDWWFIGSEEIWWDIFRARVLQHQTTNQILLLDFSRILQSKRIMLDLFITEESYVAIFLFIETHCDCQGVRATEINQCIPTSVGLLWNHRRYVGVVIIRRAICPVCKLGLPEAIGSHPPGKWGRQPSNTSTANHTITKVWVFRRMCWKLPVLPPQNILSSNSKTWLLFFFSIIWCKIIMV